MDAKLQKIFRQRCTVLEYDDVWRRDVFMISDPEECRRRINELPQGVIRCASLYAPAHNAATIGAMIDCGVDLWFVEGLCALAELEYFDKLRRQCGIDAGYVVYSMAVARDGKTLVNDGASVKEFVNTARALSPLAIGANCGRTPWDILPVIKTISSLLPSESTVYAAPCGGPDFVEVAQQIIREVCPGQRVIFGGCCGSTARDIARVGVLKNL